MLDTLLELENIGLIPADVPNYGNIESKINFFVNNHEDNSISLPIFTSPMNSVVSGNNGNYQAFLNKQIRPVLPLSDHINVRLEGCQYIFATFTLGEIQQYFLSGKRKSDKMFRICIETGNGHDSEILVVSASLKRIYGPQICIMAGNIGNPKVYVDYCKAGIDYARVGIGTGSLVNESRYGFHYPMASLLIDITGVKTVSCIGLRQTKIIADGGISSPVDIMKAIALGADYVMLGRSFAKLAEAAGNNVVSKSSKPGQPTEMLNVGEVARMTVQELRDKQVKRLYVSNSIANNNISLSEYDKLHTLYRPKEAREEWVSVTSNLQNWLAEFFDVAQYSFVLGKALNWTEYKNNIKFVRLL